MHQISSTTSLDSSSWLIGNSKDAIRKWPSLPGMSALLSAGGGSMLISVKKRPVPDWKSKFFFIVFILLLFIILFRCLLFCLSTRPDFNTELSPQNPLFFQRNWFRNSPTYFNQKRTALRSRLPILKEWGESEEKTFLSAGSSIARKILFAPNQPVMLRSHKYPFRLSEGIQHLHVGARKNQNSLSGLTHL